MSRIERSNDKYSRAREKEIERDELNGERERLGQSIMRERAPHEWAELMKRHVERKNELRQLNRTQSILEAKIFAVIFCIAIVLLLLLTFARADGVSAQCLPAAIKRALERADAACGIKIISTFRRDAIIAGTAIVSKHASCRAADFTSKDYACVYRVLADWPGKMSIDARRIGHVHLDDGRYARFRHGATARRLAGLARQKKELLHDLIESGGTAAKKYYGEFACLASSTKGKNRRASLYRVI